MRLAAIFNSCGIVGDDTRRVDKYVRGIRSLLDQKGVDLLVCMSSCLNSPAARQQVMNEFGTRISYNFIDEKITVNCSFNQTAMLLDRALGVFDGYLDIDSGVWLPHNDTIARLVAIHQNGQHGMTSANASYDQGYQQGVFEGHPGRVWIVPPGGTVNLHCQIFDRALIPAYGRLIPDIFAGCCTECTFPYLCAGLNKTMAVVGDCQVEHEGGVDGPSSGFRGWTCHWDWMLPQSLRTAPTIAGDPEARACGFGYEETHGVLPHDPALWEGPRVKDPPRLKRFLEHWFYLPHYRFDYDKIEHSFRV